MTGSLPVIFMSGSGPLNRENSLGFTNEFPALIVFQQQVDSPPIQQRAF